MESDTLQMQWSILNETVSFLNKMVTFPNGQFTKYVVLYFVQVFLLVSPYAGSPY